jgi:hypothetical protein
VSSLRILRKYDNALVLQYFQLNSRVVGRIVQVAGFALFFRPLPLFVTPSFWGVSAVTDERKKRVPIPHLQTRPATMITAIGLCLLIMLLQLMPAFQNAGLLRMAHATSSSAR